MKIALVSLNPTVGNINHNGRKILDFINEALSKKCQLIIFPELSLIGYPPKDLLHYKQLFSEQQKLLKILQKKSDKITIVVGGIDQNLVSGNPYHNCAFILQNKTFKKYVKQLLPNYDVFDEKRYFEKGSTPCSFSIEKTKFAVSICEDLWQNHPSLKKKYQDVKTHFLPKEKIDFLINISASPFEVNKINDRHSVLKNFSKTHQTALLYINQSGANDDLIFDGGYFVYSAQGRLLAQGKPFVECLNVIDTKILNSNGSSKNKTTIKKPEEAEQIFHALSLGLKDYFTKNHLSKAVLGLSGGIDSAVVACLAVHVLGRENVLGVMLPSEYSSTGSVSDSQALAANLQLNTKLVPIKQIHSLYKTLFKNIFTTVHDITDQNIQARIRGTILMAIANNDNYLLLNTTNKSEMAMGYGTLYGDMCGALAVISDLYKHQVYALANFINKDGVIIPQSIIDKEPSAELKPNQKDSDTLPEYHVLDPILYRLIDEENVKKISDKENDVLKKIMQNEYKRKQAPLGLRISKKAFGSGRRFPIVAKL